jgi:hypothetical protein
MFIKNLKIKKNKICFFCLFLNCVYSKDFFKQFENDMQAFSNSMEQFGKNMEEFANNMEEFGKGFNEDKLETINDFKRGLNSNASRKFVLGDSLYCNEGNKYYSYNKEGGKLVSISSEYNSNEYKDDKIHNFSSNFRKSMNKIFIDENNKKDIEDYFKNTFKEEVTVEEKNRIKNVFEKI